MFFFLSHLVWQLRSVLVSNPLYVMRYGIVANGYGRLIRIVRLFLGGITV